MPNHSLCSDHNNFAGSDREQYDGFAGVVITRTHHTHSQSAGLEHIREENCNHIVLEIIFRGPDISVHQELISSLEEN